MNGRERVSGSPGSTLREQGALRFLAVTNGNMWLKTFNVTAQTSSCTSSCSVCLLGPGTGSGVPRRCSAWSARSIWWSR